MDSSTIVTFVRDNKRLAKLQPYCSAAELEAYRRFFAASEISIESLNALASAMDCAPIPDSRALAISLACISRRQRLIDPHHLLEIEGADPNGMLARAIWVWYRGHIAEDFLTDWYHETSKTVSNAGTMAIQLDRSQL